VAHFAQKYQSYHSTAVKFAETMGRKSGLKVTVGGKMAYTDGRRINIPALPPGTVMTPWQATVMDGYLYHESGHIRKTDFTVWNTIDPEKEPILKKLHNLLEDVWMENSMIEDYPGTKDALDALAEQIDKDYEMEIFKIKEAKVKADPKLDIKTVQMEKTQGQRIAELLYKEVWEKHRGVKQPSVDGWLADYPELKPVSVLLDKELPKCFSTYDALQLARKVKDLLPPDTDYSAQTREGIGVVMAKLKKEDDQPGSSKKKEAMAALVTALKVRDGHDARSKELGKLLEGMGILNGQLEAEGTDPSDKKSQSPRQRMKAGTQILPPVSTEHDNIFRDSKPDIAQYDRVRSECAVQITATKKMLNIWLRAHTKKAVSKGLEEGDLDTEQLFQFKTSPRPAMFKLKRDQQMIDTAVVLMIDQSSSMNAELSRQAGILLAEAVNGVRKVKLAVMGFTTNNRHSRSPNGSAGLGRCIGLDITVFKDFQEDYNHARGKLGNIDTHGSTPLGDGYGFAMEALIPRKEVRRILWLISDGDPCVSVADYSHDEYALMTSVKKKCEAFGIETVGMYIGQGGNLRPYVKKYVQCPNASQLPKAVLEMVKEII